MSFSSEMDELRKKRMREHAESAKTNEAIKDIAPVKKTETKDSNERTWFQSGAFEDGYQFGDILKTGLSTVSDIGENITAGVLGIGEGVLDAGATFVGGIGSIFSDEFGEDVKEFVAKDVINEKKIAQTILDPLDLFDTDNDSLLGDKSEGVLQSGGQLLGQIGLNAVGVPWFVTSGVTSFGSEAENAFNQGATYGEAIGSGLITAGAEILTEKLSGGIKFGGKTLDDALTKKLATGISNKFARTALKLGLDVGGEGLEEFVSEGIGRFGQWLTYQDDKTIGEMLWSEEAVDSYIESFIGGGLLGGFGSGVRAVKGARKGRDATTGLTANEEKIFKKVYEERLKQEETDDKVHGEVTQDGDSVVRENGKELSDAEKSKIYDDVMRELQEGQIDIDTIEEMFGGDTYQTYKDTIAKEDSAMKELEELYEGDELAQAQQGIKDNSKRNELKQQLGKEVYKKLTEGKDSYLAESYHEMARRGEAYKADISKVKNENAKKTLQNIMDAKVANNTRQVHKLANLMAKISADKGIIFSVTDAKRLAQTSYAVEGKFVNGYKINTESGVEITINIDSPKYLNTIVGHEVTHALEGTEFYETLKNEIFEYAKTKGEYKSRMQEATKLYKDVDGYKGAEGFESIKNEVVSDLVGEYLFTDTDFINNLSAKHRNVFQKIYDEIMYLYKIATAGSKEAKQLERVKRVFETAYREGGKTDAKTDTKTEYSLSANARSEVKKAITDKNYSSEKSIGNDKNLSEEQKNFFKDSKVRDENGNLKVMYHGTSKGGHTVFDTYGSRYGLFGTGSYFTDNKDVAESYTKKGKGNNPQVYESYLNITNPMDMDAEADPQAWAKAFPDASFPESGTNEDFYRAMEEYFEDEQYSKAEASEVAMDALIGMGYDGITHIGGGRVIADSPRHQVYIAFNPEQIKNIDNTKPTDNADIRFSLSKDSEGNDLTDSQKEYFKNSKAVDNNGNLLKVYHTTNNDFTVFDKSKQGEATGDSNTYLGFFFADDPEYMQNFPEFANGKTDSYYLNMTNPIDMTDISKEAFMDVVEVLGGDVNEAAEIYDQELSDEQDRAMLRGDNNTSLSLVNLLNEMTGDADYHTFIEELKPHYNELMAKGYDGVVNFLDELYGAKEYIVLDSNQAKLASNKNPSADPDIRYSLDNDVKVTNSGSVTKYSLSTWTPETQTRVRENLIKSGYDADKVDKWIKDTNGVASVVAADKDRLDFVAADNQVMIKDNQEYIKTLDASTLCAKRLVYQGTFDAIQHRMPNTMLSSDDLIDLLNMMKEHGVQTPCGVCYVESRRRHLGKFAQGWLDSYNGEYKPNLDEVTTSDGLEALRKNHPQTYKDFVDAMNKKGSSNPKVVQLRTEYRNEIMSLTPKQIRDIEAIGGLRVQSFSDFETPHMLDMMQAVMDMSAKGLHSQAYTKVPNFAWVFGDTGIKINLSLIAEGDGFDADGNLAFSSTEGMDINEAMKLRDAYSQNVGTIIVGANDKHILACMADDRIDFIIPFHRSGWGMKELEMMGMSSYTDYTYGQKEHDLATGKGVANLYPPDYWDYTISGKENAERYLNLCAKTGREPKFSKFLVDNGDGSFSLQPDGSTDGYWKTLIDFKMYDNDGNGAVQQKVQPNFNMDEAYRVLGEYEGGANKLPVANDVVEEFVAKYQSSQDIAPSLSWEDEAPVKRGNFNVSSEQAKYVPMQDDIAPVQNVASEATTGIYPDDIAPMTEDEANSLQGERLASLGDADAPQEMEAPYYGESENTVPSDPFENRDIKGVGNRNVKAYMYENPEVKPFFQNEANIMLGELRDTVKGEKWFDDELYYETNGEYGFGGTSRQTTADIAYLLDNLGYTYAEIEKGLNAIIEDNGAENNACSKRIEFLLNDRLMSGYQTSDGMDIPANQGYINLLNEKQITEYNEESRKRFFESADEYAPVVDDIAPVAESAQTNASEAIKPMPEKLTGEEAQWAKNKMARADSGNQQNAEQQTAKIIVGEPETNKKSRGFNWFRTNFLDKQSVFEDLSLKTKNRELMGKANHMLSSESRAQYLIGNGTKGVKSLNDIRAEVESTGLTEQFYEYMYHKHNIDRMNLESRYKDTQNKPVFGYDVTAEKSQEIVNQLEFAKPEFKQYAQDVYNYMNHLRKQLVSNGVISQETADLWAEMYPHYVPIRRLGDSGLNISVPLDTGRTGVNAPIKKATGGSRDIMDLFDTMAMRTEQTFKAIARNSFGVELKNTLGSTIESNSTNVDEVIDSIDKHEDLLQKGENGRSPTFTVFENGEKVTFEITEDMYDALKPTADGLAKTNKALNKIGNIHRGLLTEYNPVFMATNAIKDAQDVLINSQHPAQTYKNFPKAIAELWGKKGKWYTEYMENGGEQNTYFDGKSNTFKKDDTGIKKLIGIPLNAISKANNFIERIPRLAEYIASREAGASIEVAMLDAARVTTNFSAGGDVTKFFNRNGFNFLNASVQGFNQQVRNIREAKANGLKGWVHLAAKVAVAGLPAMLLNHLLWEDDEDYEELADYVKDNYYIVAKYGDGRFVRIPKGRTMAVIQDAMEQMANVATGNDEADLRSFLELAVSNLAPNNPLENNIFAPIKQVAENKTWYGEDLVPTRLQNLPNAEQYDESTDAISKWLGETLDVSPYKINYLLNQYSGGVGDVLLPMLTPEAESGDNSLLGNIIAPMKDKFTTDSVMNNQNVSDFYDTKDELAKNANGSNATDEDVLKYKYFNSVNSKLSDLYKKKREIQNSDLDDADKYEAVRDIQKQIDSLAKQTLDSYGTVNFRSDWYAEVGNVAYRKDAKTGTWQKVSEKQMESQEEVTEELGIDPSEYWRNKTEYDFAYEYPEKYAVSKSIGGYEKYKTYSSELYDIKADKDENGKSISGSRKKKVSQYINNLDADYGEKIILFKSEYPADDTYNYEIIEYLNGREDISYSEMESILQELGFTVHSDGRITW